MMTPEPSWFPDEVVTFTCTTVGCTFAITASRTASVLFPLSAGTGAVEFVPVCSVPVVEAVVVALLLPNCQPANKPMFRTKSSSPSTIAVPQRLGLRGAASCGADSGGRAAKGGVGVLLSVAWGGGTGVCPSAARYGSVGFLSEGERY